MAADDIIHKLIEADPDLDSPEDFDVKAHIDSPVARLALTNGFTRDDRSDREERWVKKLSNGGEAWLRTTPHDPDFDKPMDLRRATGGREWEFVVVKGNKIEVLARTNEVAMNYLLGAILQRLATWNPEVPKPTLEAVDDPDDSVDPASYIKKFQNRRVAVIAAIAKHQREPNFYGPFYGQPDEDGIRHGADENTFTRIVTNSDALVRELINTGLADNWKKGWGEMYSVTWEPGELEQAVVPNVPLGEARKPKKPKPAVPVETPPEDEPAAVLGHYIRGATTPLQPYTFLLRHARGPDIEISGKVTRHSANEVHENSTTFELQIFHTPGVPIAQEDEIETARQEAEALIQKEVYDINKKIYRALNREWDWQTSDESVDENIEGNDWRFDAEGNYSRRTGFKFDKLSDEAKEVAREWYREHMNDYEWWDHIYDEWKEELNDMGFYNVEIAFSGFWSQGDGASFTADSFDLEKWTKWFFSDKPKEQGHPYTDELFMKESADDPDDPKTFIRRFRPEWTGECKEFCEVCGGFCTLIHTTLPSGRVVPPYHICKECDLKTAEVEESVDDPDDPGVVLRSIEQMPDHELVNTSDRPPGTSRSFACVCGRWSFSGIARNETEQLEFDQKAKEEFERHISSGSRFDIPSPPHDKLKARNFITSLRMREK